MRTTILPAVAALTLLIAYEAPLLAASPVGWRLDTSGRYPKANPPAHWGPDENVVWKKKLPGNSNGSPVVYEGRVFVCAEPDKLLCYGASDGELLWQVGSGFDQVLSDAQKVEAQKDDVAWQALRKQIDGLHKQVDELEKKRKDAQDDPDLKAQRTQLDKQIEKLHEQQRPLERFRVPEKSAGCSTATPVCEGQFVYVLYGTGVAACYSLEGKRQWIKLFDKPNTDWGHTASPLLVGDTLLLHFTDLAALDKRTGEVRWSQELAPSYGSPVVCQLKRGPAVVTAAGDVVSAADGKVLARKIAEPLSRCSPVVEKDVAYFMQGKAQAVRLVEKPDGMVKPEELWTAKLTSENYFSSPLVLDGLLYCVSENRQLSVLTAAEGEVVYQERLRFKKRGAVVSSLAAAGDAVFIINEEGNTKVIRAGREYDEIAENELGHLWSSPTFDGSRLFVRTSDQLIAIAAKE